MRFFNIFAFVFLVDVLFVLIYVLAYGADYSVILHNFLFVGSSFLGCCSLCFFVEGLGGYLKSRVVFYFGVYVFWVFGFFLIAFWVLVFVGLASWGRVPTMDMLAVYFFNYSLWEVLGFSCFEVFLGVSLFFLILFIVPFFLLRNAFRARDLKPLFVRNDSFTFFVFFVFGVICFFVWLNNSNGTAVHAEEPLGILIFSRVVDKSQTHNLSVSPMLERVESAERNSYAAVDVFSKRNLIVFVADALRADHMSVYGYYRDTTPNIKKWFDVSQAYKAARVRSVCAESFCGLMGLSASRPLHLLVNKPMSVYEVLQRNGYEVSLVLSGDHTNFYGLKDAYGEVDVYFDGVSQNKRYVNDDKLLIDWIEKLPEFDKGKPQAMQFHLMSTHGLGSVDKQYEVYQPFVNFYKWPIREWGRESASAEDRTLAINAYDNGVLQFDAVVARLLAELGRKGYLNDALVVITADHGEMLGEQGRFGHRFGVDEAVLNIPLIIQRLGYDAAPWPEQALVSQVDIAPTILRELGLAVPNVWVGRALQKPIAARDVFFQQGGLTGLYSTKIPNVITKYWLESHSGYEHVVFYDQRSGRELDRFSLEQQALYESLREQWRSALFKTFVPKAG